jgi:hypothetical protein
MKTIIIVLSILFTFACAQSRIEQKSNAQSNAPITQSDLEKEAANLSKLYEDKKCKKFFNAFPRNFQDFNKSYGYDDKDGARILYSRYDEQINYFFDCSEVSDLERVNKAIEISIGGKWEADAVGILQKRSFKLIEKYPVEAERILDNLSDEKASSFWYFILDGPHPEDEGKVKEFNSLLQLLGKDRKQAKLLSEQHKKVQKDWEKQ